MARARAIPLFDLQAQQYRDIRDEVLAAVTQVFDSQQFILGPEVAALEKELAAFRGCERAVGCGSGSDALLLRSDGLRRRSRRSGHYVAVHVFCYG